MLRLVMIHLLKRTLRISGAAFILEEPDLDRPPDSQSSDESYVAVRGLSERFANISTEKTTRFLSGVMTC